MSTKTTALLFASALMFAAACDTEETPDPAERAAETVGNSDLDAPADGARRHHERRDPAERLCGKIECSDEQAGAISELFANAHGKHGKHGDKAEFDHEAHAAQREAKHAALAEAFRAESFDADVLAELHGEGHEDREAAMAEHLDRGAALMVDLHALLTPEQRELLATEIEARGPGSLFGHHGKRGKHHGKRGHHGEGGKHHGEGHAKGDGVHDPSEHLARRVDHFCEAITCSEEQVAQLSATFEGVHEVHREAREKGPDFGQLAAAFRGETLDVELVRAELRASKGRDHGQSFGEFAAEVHAILTPEQRGIVADEIAEGGLHSLMGKGRHGKGHGDAPCAGKGGEGEEPCDEPCDKPCDGEK